MNDPAPTTPLPPEPPRERGRLLQLVFSSTVIIVVVVWPDLIPVVTVILALLGLHRSF
ncbi:hypothetical protein ABGB18_20205 [Nonomuraea sp. B12E4]|uniref:hypothetical protein n=1 Tax=Nonomuraea sp. B12E4 TaxID=3153564 RepID=UPI00325CB31F